MLLLRALTGTTLFAAVLTGPIAAPIPPPAEATLPPPPPPLAVVASPKALPDASPEPIKDTDITGSLSAPPGLPSGEMATLRAPITAYENADLGGGDGIAKGLSDPAARALAEWIAIRTA